MRYDALVWDSIRAGRRIYKSLRGDLLSAVGFKRMTCKRRLEARNQDTRAAVKCLRKGSTNVDSTSSLFSQVPGGFHNRYQVCFLVRMLCMSCIRSSCPTEDTSKARTNFGQVCSFGPVQFPFVQGSFRFTSRSDRSGGGRSLEAVDMDWSFAAGGCRMAVQCRSGKPSHL